jgi:hypothetical protein
MFRSTALPISLLASVLAFNSPVYAASPEISPRNAAFFASFLQSIGPIPAPALDQARGGPQPVVVPVVARQEALPAAPVRASSAARCLSACSPPKLKAVAPSTDETSGARSSGIERYPSAWLMDYHQVLARRSR